MESFQSSSPQKTSFLDFRHKKIYFFGSEKVFDFFFGMIGLPVIFLITNFFIHCLLYLMGAGERFWTNYSFIIGFALWVILLIYLAFKRTYICSGMLLLSLFLIFALLLGFGMGM